MRLFVYSGNSVVEREKGQGTEVFAGAHAEALAPDQNGQQVRTSCRKHLLEKLAQRLKQEVPRGNTFKVPLPRGELVTLACMPFED